MLSRVLLSVIISLALCSGASAERIICASTTSTQNSGLFDHILPAFKAATGIDVHVVAVGTGAALEMAKRGDADVVFVHATELELEGVMDGHFVNRHDVMYNDFIIAGPSRLRDANTATAAMKAIADNKLPFISRGDNSGTHVKELSIWRLAGIEPVKGDQWYMEAGQGMAKTLRIASEKRAYTLADRGTWLSMKDSDKLDLVIAFEGDPIMFNQYGVMAVNPERHKHVKYREAMQFVDWLISEEGQRSIAEFKDAKGNQLFVPNAK